MAERKATNKYYPPDWNPAEGSINKRSHSHHLRARAKKLDQGILVVRFELPFNVWCLGCQNHVGMGVRYNAEKSKTGAYYSTPIYTFRMKCHLCDNYFEIQTDPKNFDYAILSGARKQQILPTIEDATREQVTGSVGFDDPAETKRLMSDAMARLERKVEDKMLSESRLPTLNDLVKRNSQVDNGFALNQIIRSQYRKQRKSLETVKRKNKEILHRTCLKLDLAPSDKCLARDVLRRSEARRLELIESKQREKILSSSISLSKTKSNMPSSSKTESDATKLVRVKREPL